MTTGIHPLSRLYPILDAWRWAEALLNKQEEGVADCGSVLPRLWQPVHVRGSLPRCCGRRKKSIVGDHHLVHKLFGLFLFSRPSRNSSHTRDPPIVGLAAISLLHILYLDLSVCTGISLGIVIFPFIMALISCWRYKIKLWSSSAFELLLFPPDTSCILNPLPTTNAKINYMLAKSLQLCPTRWPHGL